MNQLAAFFAQMTSPTAATAGARVQAGAPAGDAFANILAQFQAALFSNANTTVDPATATQTVQSTATTQFLAQLPQNANLSTDDLAAQLKALADNGADTSKIDALLALLAPQQATAQPAQTEQTTETPADATLAGIIAALQQQIQAQAPQPTAAEPAATPAAQVAATATDALRGSIPIDVPADQTQQPQTPDATKAVDAAATAQAVENAAVALIVPPSTRPKSNNEQATPPNAAAPVSANTTSKQQPNNIAPERTSEQPSGKQTQIQAQESATQSSAAPKPQSDQTAPAQTKPSDTATPQQTSNIATPAPVAPTLNDAQRITMTAVTAGAPVPLDALAVHIARKFEAGASQFEINLHPADLGQVDISLSVGDDGHVQAVLRAERPETLDLLQRDARSLEQQLRQAGLDVGSNALSFSLSSGNGQRQAPFVGWPAFAQAQDADGVAKQQAASTYIAVRQQGGVDIRV